MNDCSCSQNIKTNVDYARQEAADVERGYAKRLDSFRDAIIEGANERIARTLFEAGVFRACLRLGLRRDFGVYEVVKAAEDALASNNDYDELRSFLLSNTQRIEPQSSAVNIPEMLKPLLKKGKAEGLLTARYDSKIQQAMSAYRRADRLKKQLDAWKANAKLQDKIQYSKILDVHDGSE